MTNCPVCQHSATRWPPLDDGRIYLHCPNCEFVFLTPEQRLANEIEKERYRLHQTVVEDAGYAKFVAPLIASVETNCKPGARGLDFGAGHQPVLAEHLRARNFDVEIYDPFFWPDARVLNQAYDFVTACEVIEHVFNPPKEFMTLRGLLKPGGVLVIKTEFMTKRERFDNWYYRRDPSHVSFFSPRTFEHLARLSGFDRVRIEGRVSTFFVLAK